jgi:peptidoglycan/LPS O-acetylase OafA/YrhL
MRGIAVSLVLVQHVFQPGRFAGFVGVDVFFVLSGFLITTILLAERRRYGRLRLGRFWLRRVLRLYPALALLLLACLPLAPVFSGSLLQHLERTVVAGTYTSNLFMTVTGEWLGPFTHTWSLALEEQFYLVWPLVLGGALLLARGTRWLTALVLAAAAASAVLHVGAYRYGTISAPIVSTSAGLLVGCALALLLQPSAPDRLRRALASSVTAVTGMLTITAGLVAFSFTDALPDGLYTVAAVVASALLIGHTTVRRATLTRLLSVRPVVWLGRVSYGVYLWHYPAVLLLAGALPAWSPWARLLVVIPAALGAATLSHRYVEAPFLRLKDRLDRPRPTTEVPVAAPLGKGPDVAAAPQPS